MSARRTNSDGKTAVCVVDYNPLAAAHLQRLLSADPSLELLPSEDLLGSRRTARKTTPVFVLDRPTLPTALSRYLRTLRLHFPDGRIVLLDDLLPPEELCRLLFLGIQGFLAYGDVEKQLTPAIHAVDEGHLWVAPEVLEQYVRFSAQLSHTREKKASALTRRERRILELVQRRLSNKEISAILDISESTVKFHLGNIFTKLGVSDRYAVIEEVNARTLRALTLQKAK